MNNKNYGIQYDEIILSIKRAIRLFIAEVAQDLLLNVEEAEKNMHEKCTVDAMIYIFCEMISPFFLNDISNAIDNEKIDIIFYQLREKFEQHVTNCKGRISL